MHTLTRYLRLFCLLSLCTLIKASDSDPQARRLPLSQPTSSQANLWDQQNTPHAPKAILSLPEKIGYGALGLIVIAAVGYIVVPVVSKKITTALDALHDTIKKYQFDFGGEQNVHKEDLLCSCHLKMTCLIHKEKKID